MTITVYYTHKNCGGDLIPQQVKGTYTISKPNQNIIRWQPEGTKGLHIPAVLKCNKCNQIGEIAYPTDEADITKVKNATSL